MISCLSAGVQLFSDQEGIVIHIIRPRQNNRSLEIVDPALRRLVAQVVQALLGGL